MIILENWRSHSRKATSCYTQRCATLWHQLPPLLSDLPHRGPTRGSAGTRSAPGMRSLVFCPHNHLTQETALLKRAEEVLNTHRTLKKKTFLQFPWIYHTYRFTLEKSCITIFFSLNFSFSTLSHHQRQPQCLYWEPLLILSWTFKIRVEPRNSSKFLPEWLFWVEHLDTVLDKWSQEAYTLASLCGFLSRNLQVIHNTGYGRPQPLHHESPLRLYSLLLYFCWLRVDSNPFSGPIIQFLNPINDLTPRYETSTLRITVFFKLSVKTVCQNKAEQAESGKFQGPPISVEAWLNSDLHNCLVKFFLPLCQLMSQNAKGHQSHWSQVIWEEKYSR